MNFLKSLLKYIIEGLAIALCVYLLPNKKLQMKEVLLIGLTAAAMFAILDEFSPAISSGSRTGAGLGLGLQQVGYGVPAVQLGTYGVEGFNSDEGFDSEEGFYSSSSDDVTMPPSGICTDSDKCTYTKKASSKDKSNYVCSNRTGSCSPVSPCTLDNKNKSCSMDHKYSNLADLSGKECVYSKVNGKGSCLLKKSELSKIESELFTDYLI